MAEDRYRLGAVVYNPRVERMWCEFSAWFADQGLVVAPRYYETYEGQIEDLLEGALDAAWNTNLAHCGCSSARMGRRARWPCATPIAGGARTSSGGPTPASPAWRI
ncbi:MAG TPA: hypothetical protein VGV57_07670 [Thermoleophilaceae bacterium]|nr:hypothetical protein [Thermoleophilaceae bacterium]